MAGLQEWETHPEAGTPEAAVSLSANTGQPIWMQHPEAPMPPDQKEQPAGFKNYSKVIGATEDGIPIFEDPEDTKEMIRAMAGANMATLKGIPRGLRDPVDAGAQLLTRTLESAAPEGSSFQKFMQGERQRVEAINRQGEADYKASQGADQPPVDVGRMVGATVATAPIAYAMPGAAAATFPARVASGMASGAAAGALQPVETSEQEPGDFWSEKAKQAGINAAVGSVVSGIAGGTPKPTVSPDVRKLMDAGVTPTPGQLVGGWLNRIEEAATSIPLLGDVIKSARGRAVGDFNRAAVNQALAPIGKELDAATPLGREAIEEASTKIKSAYDNLLPSLKLQADPQFVSNLQTLRANAQNMHPDRAAQLDAILEGQVARKFSPGGGMTGESFKEVESELGRLSSDYSHSALADERQLGGAIRQVQAEMRDLLTRSNPTKAAELGNINTAYSNLLRVQGAAARIGSEQGVFTPAQLLSVTRELDPTLRKSAFAKGNARMQDLAEAGKSVLGNKVPDSGTPLRSMVALGALAPAYMAEPVTTTAALLGGSGVASLYTKPGQSALARALTSQVSPGRRLLAPPLATLPASLMGGQGSNPSP